MKCFKADFAQVFIFPVAINVHYCIHNNDNDAYYMASKIDLVHTFGKANHWIAYQKLVLMGNFSLYVYESSMIN